jgi:hypothetical protein
MFLVRYETKQDDCERAHAKKLLNLSAQDVSVIMLVVLTSIIYR